MDDLGIFSAFDDNMMLNQIQATHSPDGLELDVGPVLELIESIFKRVEPNIEGGHEEMYEEESVTNGVSDNNGVLESLAFVIQKVSCKISYKCSKGRDAHSSTMFLLNTLSSYSWDTKVVISLAAFAISYGELFLTIFCCPTNNLAKSISLLKQLPNAIEYSFALKPHFDTLHNLIKAMTGVTKCIIELRHLPPQHISPEDHPPLSNAMAYVPIAVYWTIRSVVACVAQMASFVGMSFEYIESTMESWEVSRLAHKEKNIHDHLLQQLDLCYQHISQQESILLRPKMKCDY